MGHRSRREGKMPSHLTSKVLTDALLHQLFGLVLNVFDLKFSGDVLKKMNLAMGLGASTRPPSLPPINC